MSPESGPSRDVGPRHDPEVADPALALLAARNELAGRALRLEGAEAAVGLQPRHRVRAEHGPRGSRCSGCATTAPGCIRSAKYAEAYEAAMTHLENTGPCSAADGSWNQTWCELWATRVGGAAPG